MELIKSLIESMESFNESLNQVKLLIGEVKDQMKQQTKSLESEPEDIERQVALIALESEHEIEEKIFELREELDLLEQMKQIHQQANEIEKSSLPDVRNTAFGKLVSEIVRDPQIVRETPKPTPDSKSEMSSKNAEWWKVDYDLLEYEKENVNWKVELFERQRNRTILKVSPGWNKKLTTCKDIENTLTTYTDSIVNWSVEKTEYTRSDGGPIVWIKFDSVEDCLTIKKMAKETGGFDGFFNFNMPRTNIELLEKRKMQTMVDILRARRYYKVFCDEMKIKVDGQWWKYCWGEGWKRL